MDHRFSSVKPTADLPLLLATFEARRQSEGDGGGRSWYSIRNISASEAEIFLYDPIGAWGIPASDFIKELREVKADTITLRINSPGGDVFDGVAIYNACKRHRAEINVYVDGIAASAASFVAMAGDTVTMMPHSQMMIHEAQGLVIGPAEEMRKMADILDKSSDNIAGIYAERAGGSIEEWRQRMKGEAWFSDREAVDVGLADRIEGVEEEGENRADRIPVAPDGQVVEAETPKPAAPDFLQTIKRATDNATDSLYKEG